MAWHRSLTSGVAASSAPRTASRRRFAVLVAVGLVVTACGGADSGGSATTDEPGPTTTSPPATTTTAATQEPAAEPTPACDRFTPAELRAALGPTFGEGVADDDGQVCFWEADASNQVSLTVRPAGLLAPDRLCQTMATPASEHLEVAWSPAVFEGRQLFVCTETESFNLLTNTTAPGEEIQSVLIELATLGLSR